MSLLQSQDPYPVGTRVYAVRNETDDTVFVYGFGTYDGMQPIDRQLEMESPFGKLVVPVGTPNPRIKLDDSNDFVWGFECWWAKEDQFDAKYKGKQVVKVSIAEFRSEVEQREFAVKRSVEIVQQYLDGNGVGDGVGLIGDSREFHNPDTHESIYVVAAYVAIDKMGQVVSPKLIREWKERENKKRRDQGGN